MDKTTEALRMALEALELSAVTVDSFGVQKKTNEAITTIKEALAQQEPVAWEQFYPDIGKPQIAINSETVGYVAPQRTWVGLTKEQLATTDWSADFRAGALWAEAKLKEKNT